MRCSGGSYTRESDVENLDRKFLKRELVERKGTHKNLTLGLGVAL